MEVKAGGLPPGALVQKSVKRAFNRLIHGKKDTLKKKVNRIAKAVSSGMRQDVRLTTLDVNGFSNLPAISICNTIATGDLFNQRQGDSILPKRLMIRWTAQVNAVATSQAPRWIRWLVVRDKQPAGAVPNAGSLFQNVSAATGDSITINSPINVSQPGVRFKVLFDKTYDLNKFISATDVGVVGGRMSTIHGKILVTKGFGKWQYTQAGTTGGIAECLKNNILIVYFTDIISTAAAGSNALVSLQSHLKFQP